MTKIGHPNRPVFPAAYAPLVDVEPLWTYAQTAEFLGLSVRTLKRWVADGTLAPVDLPGRSVRFRAAEVRGLAERSRPVRERPKPAPLRALRRPPEVRQEGLAPAVRGRSYAERLAASG